MDLKLILTKGSKERYLVIPNVTPGFIFEPGKGWRIMKYYLINSGVNESRFIDTLDHRAVK